MTTTLSDVHNVYKKVLYLENFNFIDTLLATYKTTFLDGEPLWMFPVALSSYGKSVQMSPFMKLSKMKRSKPGEEGNPYNILFLDQATVNAFTSGLKELDLGSQLQNKKTFIIIPDLASILSMDIDEGKKLFALWRTLYDGYIIKYTGRKDKNYPNCHVNMFACSTPSIRKSIELSTLMGTREILYNVAEIEHPDMMLTKDVTPENKEEMYQVVRAFLDDNKDLEFKEFKLPGGSFGLEDAVDYISIWRAEAEVNIKGELISNVEKEYPSRLYKQLDKLCRGLYGIGVTPKEIQNILIEINKGVGNRLRRKVYESLYRIVDEYGYREPDEKDLSQLANLLNRSKEAIMTQLMVLRELGLIQSGGDIFDKDTKWSTESYHLEKYRL